MSMNTYIGPMLIASKELNYTVKEFPSCQHLKDDGDKFCPTCGKKVDTLKKSEHDGIHPGDIREAVQERLSCLPPNGEIDKYLKGGKPWYSVHFCSNIKSDFGINLATNYDEQAGYFDAGKILSETVKFEAQHHDDIQTIINMGFQTSIKWGYYHYYG